MRHEVDAVVVVALVLHSPAGAEGGTGERDARPTRRAAALGVWSPPRPRRGRARDPMQTCSGAHGHTHGGREGRVGTQPTSRVGTQPTSAGECDTSDRLASAERPREPRYTSSTAPIEHHFSAEDTASGTATRGSDCRHVCWLRGWQPDFFTFVCRVRRYPRGKG